jgi:hypothetical protein
MEVIRVLVLGWRTTTRAPISGQRKIGSDG